MEWIVLAVVVALLTYIFSKKPAKDLRERWKKGMRDGWEFEKFVADLLNRCGYRASATKGSHDFGTDIIVVKKGELILLQAKYLSSPPVSTVLDEALAAGMIYGARQIGLVTNTFLTESLKEYARKIEQTTFVKRVILLGREELERLLNGEKLI